jgi:drug/metabolite transporter (DMT)-like permease
MQLRGSASRLHSQPRVLARTFHEIFSIGRFDKDQTALSTRRDGFGVTDGGNRLGYLYVVLAAMCWASGASASKFLFAGGITPFQLVQLRITTACAVLMVWLLWRRPHLLRISRRDTPYFLLLGTLGMAAINITYLYAISRLNVAAALILEYLAPVLIAAYTVLVRRERISAWTALSMAAALAGCYLVVGAYSLDLLQLNLPGILSGLGAAAAFAWWSVHGEYGMHRYNPWTVLFYALLVAAVEWNLLHPPLEAFLHRYDAATWGWILFVAVVGAILPFGLYYEGINRIRATRASITSTVEPIAAGILSFVFLGESMGALQIAGGALVIGSIVLLQLEQERDERTPARIRADRRAGRGGGTT